MSEEKKKRKKEIKQTYDDKRFAGTLEMEAIMTAAANGAKFSMVLLWDA